MFKTKYNNYLQTFPHTLQHIYDDLTIMNVPTTLTINETSTEIDPIVEAFNNRYSGYKGNNYKKGAQISGYKNKPNANICQACGLNNYDIIKGINTLHT